MIKYKLVCNDCNFLFDSWFASSNEYEKLKKRNFLNCLNCNSYKVKKTLMSPQLIQNAKKNEIKNDHYKLKNINTKIREYQKFIKNNFEYVGKNFAYEARSIHYNDKKKDKGIYGTASSDEVKELKEEGIHADIIPWVKDESN